MVRFRQWVIGVLIRIAERELYSTPIKRLDQERMTKFLANLWETPGFREYLVDRETRMVHAQAEKWTEAMRGQRAENTLLYLKTKGAWNKLNPKKQDTPAKAR